MRFWLVWYNLLVFSPLVGRPVDINSAPLNACGIVSPFFHILSRFSPFTFLHIV